MHNIKQKCTLRTNHSKRGKVPKLTHGSLSVGLRFNQKRDGLILSSERSEGITALRQVKRLYILSQWRVILQCLLEPIVLKGQAGKDEPVMVRRVSKCPMGWTSFLYEPFLRNTQHLLQEANTIRDIKCLFDLIKKEEKETRSLLSKQKPFPPLHLNKP